MNPQAVLIQSPKIDLSIFLQVTRQVLGRNLAEKADGSIQALSESDRFLSCLAEMQESPSDLRKHVFFTVLVLGLEDDLFEMVEIASLPYITAETSRRGVFSAVMSGPLDEWEEAIARGVTSPAVGVREGFNAISTLFSKRYKRLTG